MAVVSVSPSGGASPPLFRPQNLPVNLLGLLQPTGLVVLQCKLHRLIDSDLGHVLALASDL